MWLSHMLNLEGIQVWQAHKGLRWKFRAVTVEPPQQCPGCHTSTSFLKYGRKDFRFDDLPLHGLPVRVRLTRQRYKCVHCAVLFFPSLDCLDASRHATRRLVEAIARDSLHRPFSHVAKECGVHEATVRRVAHSFFQALDAIAHLPTPRWLGIDEVTIRGIPRIVLTNLQHKLVYDILPDAKPGTISTFLRRMPGREEVAVVCIDLCAQYRKIVRDTLPDAVIVIDKFHLIQLGTKAVDHVRRALKRRRGVRLKYDTRIVRKRRHNLNAQDQDALEYWKTSVPALATAFELKESFCEIWSAPTQSRGRALYQAWEKQCLTLAPDAFRPRINQVRQWQKEIFNLFKWPNITNGYTERVNGIAKHVNRTTRRLAFDAFRVKLLYVHGYRRPPAIARLEPKAEWPELEVLSGEEEEYTGPVPLPPKDTVAALADTFIREHEWNDSPQARPGRRVETLEDVRLMENATRDDPDYARAHRSLSDVA